MRKRILKIILCPVILLTRLILCAAAFVTSLAGSVIGLTALLFGILSLMAFVTGSWQNGIAFAVLMLLTFFLSLALDAAGLLPFSPIGILMPGIIAREFDRQGFRDSLLAMAVTTGLTALALLLVGGALAGL